MHPKTLTRVMETSLQISTPERKIASALCGILLLTSAIASAAGDPATTLWFDKPATSFHSSLPLGNGRIGAMVFGGLDEERIVLNESSVWSGSVQDSDRPDAHKALPEIRELLLEGKNAEAEELVNKNFTCKGEGSAFAKAANAPFGCYQVLGNLHLRFDQSSGEATGYRRELDLATGSARVTYQKDGATWTREHLVSAPDEVFASKLSTTKPGGLSFTIALDRPERFTTTAAGNHDLLITGTLNDGHGGKGVTYAARLRAIVRGGSVRAEGNQLLIENADEAILLLTAATDYRGFAGRNLSDPLAATLTDLEKAAAKPFAEIAATQRADHGKWFDRVKLTLPETPNSQLPADRRLDGFAQGAPDPSLAALYFNFGRHLLISSSRPGGLPPNLQGIWAEEIQTPWNGDWHLDINVQMNYWPAEICDLSELHQPLHDLIASLVEPGRKTARAYYNSRGWIAHVFTTPWGFTSPGESASWGATVSGSAWLCQHLWEHYAFTGDKEFLRRVYPILKESCLFYLDNLIEEPKRGWLVTGPSNSPENRFKLPNGKIAHVCLGPTVDMQLLRELFGNTTRAAEILDLDPELRAELSAKRKRLAPNLIGPDGRLQEWLEPYDEPEPTHRHTSPLYGLHPYYEITRRGTPELAEACRKLLESRGDDSTGWALAWRMNLWARLGDGDRAMKLFKLLLRPAGNGSGSLPNLFGSCPPFQIDANFGGCAGVAEMLVQSHAGEIELLPALPKDWPDGSVAGLKTRGGFRVSITWKSGELTAATIESTGGRQTKVRHGEQVIPVKLEPGAVFRIE
jgi:alpha-L-fucosidase 2